MTSTQNVYFIGLMLIVIGGLTAFIIASLRSKREDSIEAHTDPEKPQKVVTHYKVSDVDAEKGVVTDAAISTLSEWALLNKHGRLLESTPTEKYSLNSSPIREKKADTPNKRALNERAEHTRATRANDSHMHELTGIGLGLAMLNSSTHIHDDGIHIGLFSESAHSVDDIFDSSINGCSTTSTFDDISICEPINGINPASGLPMINDCMDVGGNMFGTDSTDITFDDPFSSSSIGSAFDDSFSGSAFDDSFGSSSFGISSDPFD
ncbi:hypothetical protein HJ160_02800 [Vibrio parahaemolyticus]|nr:hypothetical protein [Vibrio parahaemolyticus]